MKKLVVAVLAMMVCFTGCSKDEETEQGQGTVKPEEVFRGKRVVEKGSSSYFDQYAYDQDGRLVSVKHFDDGKLNYEEILKYENNKLIITTKGGDEIDYKIDLVINENGFAESGSDVYYEKENGVIVEYTSTYEFKYTADGYLSEAKYVEDKGTPEEETHLDKYVYIDGNIVSHSSVEDGKKGQEKTYTTGAVENKGGAFNSSDFDDTLYYAGVLGKSTKNLITKVEAINYYSETPTKYALDYAYELDKDGYVLKEKTSSNEASGDWYINDSYKYN